MNIVPVIDFEDDSSEEDEIEAAGRLVDNAPNMHISPASSKFMSSFESIASNPWNESAWDTCISESRKGNGGLKTYEDVLKLALRHFPTSATYHKLLTDYYWDKGDFVSFDSVMKEAVVKCRNVELWMSYLKGFRQRNVDVHAHASENFTSAKKACQDLYEKGIESVGMSVQASPLWNQYLEYVKSWPETGPLDTGRKLSALREIYRKAVCNPMENLDVYWKEYEQFEMQAGEHLAVQMLSELSPRHTHAKIVYKERSRLASVIDFSKLALPPSGSMQDISHIKSWNALLKYDLSNPDNRSVEEHRQYMRMIFDQCLNTCRFYPEVWLSYAAYELKRNASHLAAREILQNGISVLPEVSLLRFHLAEIEEKHFTVDIALETLRNAFSTVPSAVTFTVLQRFVRRHFGIIAARQIFTETQTFRQCGSLGIEVFMVHAAMELDVNCNGNVALNILNYAKSTLQLGKHVVEFSKLYARVLSSLRRHDEMRDYFESILAATEDVSRGSKTSEEQLLLWRTFLQCMTQSNVCDVDMQHTIIDKIAQLVEASSGQKTEDQWVLYEFDLGIYNNTWMTASLTASELSFIQRSRARMPQDITGGAERGIAHEKHSNTEKSNLPSASLAPSIRSFLSRLPPHSGAIPDASSYLESLKKTILPPRPVESTNHTSTSKRKIDDVTNDDDKRISDGAHKNLFTSRQRMKL